MKKFLSIILVITMLLLPLNGATVNAVIPGEDAYNSDDLKIYEYDIGTGNISVKTLGELRATVDPTRLAASAVNGVATTQGYTPEHLQNYIPEITPNSFLGSWVIIGTPNTERYRRTVHLTITYPNGAQTGTGFMVGPSTVATAGHLVYNAGFGGYATSVVATPTYNAGAAPYGSARAVTLVTNEGWTVENDYGYDWAVITLNSNIGDSTGWLSVRYQTSTYNGTTGVDVLGYPGVDENGNIIQPASQRLYRSTGSITTTKTRQLVSNNTNTSDGMSGGPVQKYYTSTGYTAIALVSGSAAAGNVFTRITEEVYDFFVSYNNTRV